MTAQRRDNHLDQETIDELRKETQWLIAENLARQDLFMAAKAVRDVRLGNVRRVNIPQAPTCTHDDGIERLAARIEHNGWLLGQRNMSMAMTLELEREQETLRTALALVLAPESRRATAMKIIEQMTRDITKERESDRSAE